MVVPVFSFILSWFVGIVQASELEKSLQAGYLGEKNPPVYAGPWRPVFSHDPYFGQYRWDDELFFGSFFLNYIWFEAPEWGKFLSEEVVGASSCPHDVLSKNFDDIRYAHRLLALSYILEGLDLARLEAVKLRAPDTCLFDLSAFLKQCRPQSEDMKTLVRNLAAQSPFSSHQVDRDHNFNLYQREWLSSLRKRDASVGALRVSLSCHQDKESCQTLNLSQALTRLSKACDEDRKLFQSLCSETDHIYGNASSPLSTYLLATSNMVTLFDQEGYAQGCLRRFGQMMAPKENIPLTITVMMPAIHSSLKQRFGERYPQGRAFIYGALKEFQQKGLTEVFEPKVEPEVVISPPKEELKPVEVVVSKPILPQVRPVVSQVVEPPKPVVRKEILVELKSAFLQAAEVRVVQDLERVDVDMLKFRYDYVFSKHELQLLEHSLKDFTSREALSEMRRLDKLGTQEAPMPLTFLKFMLETQNHQGLYNVTAILGEKFWVQNDVDSKFKPKPEYCEVKNDGSTRNQWQFFILKPNEL